MRAARAYVWTLQALLAVIGLTTAGLIASERPRGQVRGTLLTAEAGRPLADIRVSLVSVEASGPTYRTVTDPKGRFAFRHVQAGEYILYADTEAHEQPEERITVREGQTTSGVFELAPSDPFLRLMAPQRVFTTKEPIQFRCHGFAPVASLDVAVYRVDPSVAVEAWGRWLGGRLTTHGRSLDSVELDTVPELTLALQQEVAIRKRDAEGVFRHDVKVDSPGPGMYLLCVKAGDLSRMVVVTVTDLAIVAKASPKQWVVFATDLETGQPKANVRVHPVVEEGLTPVFTTDAKGLCRFAPPGRLGDGSLRVVAEAEGSLAVAQLYIWHEESGPLRVYVYTDRPVYRPGQKVYFKAIARRIRGDHYQVPKGVEFTVRVEDEIDDVIYNAQHTTNAFGSIWGEFELPENALPGGYTILLTHGGARYRGRFSVAEYRKPKFEVHITTAKKRYVIGDTLQAVVEAEYYYGAPVAGAKVDWYITRTPRWWYWGPVWEGEFLDEDLFEPDEYYEEGGEIVASGTGKTDENGRLVISAPTAVKTEGEETQEGGDWTYTIWADVEEEGFEYESGSASILVTQGEFRLSAEPRAYVTMPGQEVVVDIRAVDYDDKSVAGLSGEAVVGRVEWTGDTQKIIDQQTLAWTTDEAGVASVRFTPRREGDWMVEVRAADRAGNTVISRCSVWVAAAEWADFPYPYQDLDVSADKKLYREGETARIVVNTKHAPVDALVTVEGQDIYQAQVRRLEGKTNIIKLKVTRAFMPTARVSVCFVKNKQLISGTATVAVSREKRALVVRVKPDKNKYLPGERAVYEIQTTTPDGRPVSAEVSVGVVDEAIYAIRRDNAEDILRFFYPKRYPAVETAFSFPEVYLSADDKAAGARILTRRRFLDTAYWAPAVVTDASGRALVEFTLPDNLTTWRTTCRAISLDTRAGQATQKVIVNKPLVVRLEAPRFFTQRDQVTIAAVVHNLTETALTPTVGIDADGIDVSGSTRKCTVGPGKTQRVDWNVKVTGVESARVRVWADAGQLSDAMELKLPIRPKGRQRIAVESGVLAPQRAEDEEGTGSAVTEELRFEVRRDCIPGTQKLTVRMSPSIASGMLSALEYLAQYPYGCVEQTMSAFLPDVVLVETLKELGLENRSLEKELPKMVQAGLLKLYAYQHGDGGWGWWEYDDTDAWMTAYVVFGLARAQAAGFAVNPRVFQEGVQWLVGAAEEKELEADTEAFAAYTLALINKRAAAESIVQRYQPVRHRQRVSELSDWGRACLAAAMGRLGWPDDGRWLLDGVLRRYSTEEVRAFAGDMHWTDAECAAMVLAAGCQLMPDDPRLVNVVGWLMDNRQGRYWYSTRATAFTLYAMSDYLALTGEVHPDILCRVSVNGRVVETKRFTRRDVFQPEVEVVVGPEDIGAGEAIVTLEAEGLGRVYYSAELRQVVAVDLTVPVHSSSGITIERKYVNLGRGGRQEPETATGGRGKGLSCSSGDIIEVKLIVRCEGPVRHMMIEDPLPAGCEVPDRGRVERWEWSNWWAQQIIRDEKVAFAADRLSPGEHVLTYRMRARIPGLFTALPPEVYSMYRPTVRGDGVADTVRISP